MTTDPTSPPGPAQATAPSGGGFWGGAFPVSSRLWLMMGLVACFGIQTYLVYSDAQPEPALTGKALEGRRIWHENNCQSCHQFYGFGGFLGPDLTNVSPLLTRQRLETVLKGYRAMPAFPLSSGEIDAIEAFLAAMNETGVGQARAGSGEPPEIVFERIVGRTLEEDPEPLGAGADAIRRGFGLTQEFECRACHTPFATSSVGAPDFSSALARIGGTALTTLLKEGRGEMPALEMTDAQIGDLQAYLQWLGNERESLETRLEESRPQSIDWSKLPWWAYP